MEKLRVDGKIKEFIIGKTKRHRKVAGVRSVWNR